ncbi:MAG: peptidoglycan DD-metalloendopeptidase family protein [Caulobacteraceae bacterium]
MASPGFARKAPAWLAALAIIAAIAAVGLPMASHGGQGRRPPARKSAQAAPSPRRPLAVTMGPRESLQAALTRAGLSAAQAGAASDALAEDFDVINPHPGLALAAEVEGPAGRSARLASLALRSADGAELTLYRRADGALRVRRSQTDTVRIPEELGGVIDGSLYLSVVEAGVAPDAASGIVRLFGRSLDLTRDLESGETFRLVFERDVAANGERVGPAELIFAEVQSRQGPRRLYRFEEDGAAPAWLDGSARGAEPILLRTPVDGARITSGFGPRLHPILGYTRMHQGVDFGAPLGSPVLAAGDGVVEQVRWAGGFGRWLRIRHATGLETGYAHLSAWAAGIAPGVLVHQGQVIGFVGESGLATGPHLHYQVFMDGRPVDPKTTQAVRAGGLSTGELAAFAGQKARIDALAASARERRFAGDQG